MPNRLYATPEAPENWFALFQELADLPWNGHTELHRTNRSTGPKSTDSTGREYPSVWHIDFVPLHWESLSTDQINRLTEIADRHEAVIRFTGRDSTRYKSSHFIAEFKAR